MLFVKGVQKMYEIFEKLIQKFNLTAYRVSIDTGVTQTALSNWKNGRSTPSRETLQKLAKYFNVSIEYLLGEETTENVQYYLNDETRIIAQEIFDNKDLRILFDASRKAKPDDLKLIIEMAKRFRNED